MRANRLLRLYPRAWRERYGAEVLEIAGPGPLTVQQVIDIVSGAIDAWLSADVRRATTPVHVAASGGGRMTLKSLMVCERRTSRYTARDGMIGTGVMIGATLIFTMSAFGARRGGWPVTGDILMNIGLFGSLTLSLPFWLMKGQPWKAQVVIVGTTLFLLAASGYLAAL